MINLLNSMVLNFGRHSLIVHAILQCTYMKVDFIIAAICWMNSTTRHITILDITNRLPYKCNDLCKFVLKATVGVEYTFHYQFRLQHFRSDAVWGSLDVCLALNQLELHHGRAGAGQARGGGRVLGVGQGPGQHSLAHRGHTAARCWRGSPAWCRWSSPG